MKLLIIGYARHGKDSAAEILAIQHGFKFISSSEFVGREVIWPEWGKSRYDTFQEMYDDRVNCRKNWFQMISIWNTPDKARTARAILERGYDMYVGMRARDEFEASLLAGLFDHIVWVDRSLNLKEETTSSNELVAADATYILDNNGSLSDLEYNISEMMWNLQKEIRA